MMPISSASANASCWSCVTSSAVVPAALMMSRTSIDSRSRRSMSRFENGSSSSSSSGLRRERAGKRHPLLLAAGELVRIRVAAAGQADEREHRRDALARGGIRAAAETEADVAGNGQVREQRVVLEHHPDAAPLRRGQAARFRHHDAVQRDPPAGQGFETGEAAQHRRLAAARRTEQAADAPGRQAKRESAHDALRAVRMFEFEDVDRGCHGRGVYMGWRPQRRPGPAPASGRPGCRRARYTERPGPRPARPRGSACSCSRMAPPTDRRGAATPGRPLPWT